MSHRLLSRSQVSVSLTLDPKQLGSSADEELDALQEELAKIAQVSRHSLIKSRGSECEELGPVSGSQVVRSVIAGTHMIDLYTLVSWCCTQLSGASWDV